MYNPAQNHSPPRASSYAGLAVALANLRQGYRGIPSAYLGCLLCILQLRCREYSQFDQPSTTKFFSGSFLPVAALSSIEDHISFSSSLLLGRPLLATQEGPDLLTAVLRFMVGSCCGVSFDGVRLGGEGASVSPVENSL